MAVTNGRLRFQQGSDRHKTLRKHVSDDSERFVFRRRKNLLGEIFGTKNLGFCRFGVDLGELRPNGQQNQLPHQILL